MSAAVPTASGAPPSIPLRARRCVRHTGREAVARCAGCGGSFCRECVVEHAGRLYCAPCARAEVAATTVTERRLWWPVVKRAAATGLAVVVAWLVFYVFIALAAQVPTQVHDGLLWSESGWRGGAP